MASIQRPIARVQVNIRFPAGLHIRAAQAARKAGLSLNEYVVTLVGEALKK